MGVRVRCAAAAAAVAFALLAAPAAALASQRMIVADKDFYLIEAEPGEVFYVRPVVRLTGTKEFTPAVLTVEDVSVDENGKRVEKDTEPGNVQIERPASWVNIKARSGAVLPAHVVRFGLLPDRRKPVNLVVRVPLDAYPGDRDIILTVRAGDDQGEPARILLRLRVGGGDIYSAAMTTDIRAQDFVLGSGIDYQMDVENTGNLAQRVEGTGTVLVAGFTASEPSAASKLDLVPGEKGTLAGRITLPWSALGFQRLRVEAVADPLGSFSEAGSVDLEAETWVFVVPRWLAIGAAVIALTAAVGTWGYRDYRRRHRYLED